MSGKVQRQLVTEHVAGIESSLADCEACATQIGVLLWQDGRPFVQECPACGAVITAQRLDGCVEAKFAGWREQELRELTNSLFVLRIDTQDEEA